MSWLDAFLFCYKNILRFSSNTQNDNAHIVKNNSIQIYKHLEPYTMVWSVVMIIAPRRRGLNRHLIF
jgi:hypothetical protein